AERQPEHDAPGGQRLRAEGPANVQQLGDDVEDRAGGKREEEDREVLARPRVPDRGADEGRRAADHAHQSEEPPARQLGLAAQWTSQNRKSRMPDAVAVKKAFSVGDSPRIRPIGRPRKIGRPAIAPSSSVWAVDIL